MSPAPSRRATVVTDDLRDRGFTLEAENWASIARGESTEVVGVDAPLAVVPLRNDNPLTVVSTIGNAAHEGQVPLLVTDQRLEAEIEPILSDPFLLRGERVGGREFFPVEDRIRLSDDSYACVGATGAMEWFENSGSTDDPPLVLRVDGETVATLDSVDSLACPGPSVSAFQYSYARGDDGQFRVFANGETVGRYPGVSAMRADGFRPVSLPLIPEHHVRDHGRLARATTVASVGSDGTVSYRPLR